MTFRTSPLWMVSLLTYIGSLLFQRDSFDIEQPPINVQSLGFEYDYIIVGGGSAGSVLANRLSEDPNVTVALLEAGGQETTISVIPGLAGYLQLSKLDWQYKVEPSTTSCLAMFNNRCNFPRGKVIGGSSSINYMVYVRGNRRDYDLWELMGNTGWGFKHVLPFFKLLEDNTNASLAEDTEYHSAGGYLTVGEAPWRTELAPAFTEAGHELGYPVRDCNGPYQTGFMIPQGFIRDGYRCSNARAYLRPVRNRPNLHVALGTFVTKVLIHPVLKRAFGVLYNRKGKNSVQMLVRREVILTAGAISTPQLLMLSGIGPAKDLALHGIPVIADLPVGKNLQDHVASGPLFTVEKPVSLQTNCLTTIPTIVQYATLGTGPLTTLGGVEGIGFISTKYGNQSDDWPDIEYHFLSGSHGSDRGEFYHKLVGLRLKYWTDYYSHLQDVHHFTIITKLMRPLSRGYIQLKSSNPYDHPKIVANYFDKRLDILVLVEGMKKAVELGQTKAFKRFGAKLYDRLLPGCEQHPFNSDSYWECYARHLTFTIYHYSGTAKMGPYWDAEAVVDPQLRVYGIGGLRVADASIFPTITTGNTNAPVTMVAETAAHIVKEFYANHTVPPIPVKHINVDNTLESNVNDEL